MSTAKKIDFEKQQNLRSVESETLLPSFEKAPSESTSLIDDSVRQLHGLMSDVRTAIKSKGTERMDPQLVNAACNCAKQISGLLKLQLQWEKGQKTNE